MEVSSESEEVTAEEDTDMEEKQLLLNSGRESQIARPCRISEYVMAEM